MAAASYPMPTAEGFYWAKLLRPSRMPSSEDWASVDWEVVHVIDNHGKGAERFGVFVGGVSPMQWLPDFEWGPRVPPFAGVAP